MNMTFADTPFLANMSDYNCKIRLFKQILYLYYKLYLLVVINIEDIINKNAKKEKVFIISKSNK